MTASLLERTAPAVVTRPLLIGSPAPGFATRTTMGERSLEGYRGRWLVFFSHPADFTPVCTSEFVAFSKAYSRFQALGCDLLALSIDSLFSHIAWVRSIKERFGVTVPFPITEDPSMAIAASYGMIHPDAADSSTVRATFVIDPEGLIRAMVWYPMSTGRSVEEILRLVEALQTSDREAASTPEGWRPGDALIEPAPLTLDAVGDQQSGDETLDWYYRLRKR
jgi:peroxiredoxin (alkyl hydroperoxide reductase subunit C)